MKLTRRTSLLSRDDDTLGKKNAHGTWFKVSKLKEWLCLRHPLEFRFSHGESLNEHYGYAPFASDFVNVAFSVADAEFQRMPNTKPFFLLEHVIGPLSAA